MVVAASTDGVFCGAGVPFHQTRASALQWIVFAGHFRQGTPNVLNSGKTSVTGSSDAPPEASVKPKRRMGKTMIPPVVPGSAYERSGRGS